MFQKNNRLSDVFFHIISFDWGICFFPTSMDDKYCTKTSRTNLFFGILFYYTYFRKFPKCA